MRRKTTIVAIVARCRDESDHVLTKDWAVTGAQLCHNILHWKSLFGCCKGRRSAIKQFSFAAINFSSDRILVNAADGESEAGVI